MTNQRSIGPRETFFRTIMSSRIPLSLAQAGKAMNLKITSATHGYVGPLGQTGDIAVQDIYNLNAYKVEVERSANFQADLVDAIKAEMSGDDEGAQERFNDLLNRCQLKTSVINRDGMAQQFAKGEIVKVLLDSAEAADRDRAGNKLETKHTTLVVASITPIMVSAAPAKRGYDFDPLLDEEQDEEPQAKLAKTAKPVAAKPVAAKKAAVK